MTDYKNNWQAYMDAWAETDSEKQLALLKQALDEDSYYTDPLTENSLKGYEAIQAYVIQTQKMIPGVNLKLKNYHQHHNSGLAEWDMCDGEGNNLSSGYSFARYSKDQKITETVGFFPPSLS